MNGLTHDHAIHSSLREKVLEQMFVSQICRELWQLGVRDLEVLHATTDSAGYDIVVEALGKMRHIQLKSSIVSGSTQEQKVNVALAGKQDACVIWMLVDGDTLDVDHFLWFGAPLGAGMPTLGERVAKHTKANSEGIKKRRKNIRVLARGKFVRVNTVSQLVQRLFYEEVT